MGKEYIINVKGNNNIYTNEKRILKVYYSVPDKGVDDNTGIILLIGGYGESAINNTFSNTRNLFSDAYNMIVVQCDYFGCNYMDMQYDIIVEDEELLSKLSDAEISLLNNNYERYKHILQGKVFEQYIDTDESIDCFNDMGPMQAIDNVSAIISVLQIFESQKKSLNINRIYVYGKEHGAYLAYLCNRLAPNLIKTIIDNSAYLFPCYYNEKRTYTVLEDGITVAQHVNYRCSEYMKDEEILDLNNVYRDFNNKAQIVCFSGEDDKMISTEEKKKYLAHVDNSIVETITKSRVDMVRFKNTGHCLEADFIELYHYAYLMHVKPLEEKYKKPNNIPISDLCKDSVIIQSNMYKYETKWHEGSLVLYREAI